jgi:hypothetical protein
MKPLKELSISSFRRCTTKFSNSVATAYGSSPIDTSSYDEELLLSLVFDDDDADDADDLAYKFVGDAIVLCRW